MPWDTTDIPYHGLEVFDYYVIYKSRLEHHERWTDNSLYDVVVNSRDPFLLSSLPRISDVMQNLCLKKQDEAQFSQRVQAYLDFCVYREKMRALSFQEHRA